MIRDSAELHALERRYVQEIIGPMTYADALARFAALWAHALALDPGFPGAWEDDIQPDLAMARLLNGLPDRK